jgi:hypothetical protein
MTAQSSFPAGGLVGLAGGRQAVPSQSLVEETLFWTELVLVGSPLPNFYWENYSVHPVKFFSSFCIALIGTWHLTTLCRGWRKTEKKKTKPSNHQGDMPWSHSNGKSQASNQTHMSSDTSSSNSFRDSQVNLSTFPASAFFCTGTVISIFFYKGIIFFVVPGFELRASDLVGRLSTAWVTPPTQ